MFWMQMLSHWTADVCLFCFKVATKTHVYVNPQSGVSVIMQRQLRSKSAWNGHIISCELDINQLREREREKRSKPDLFNARVVGGWTFVQVNHQSHWAPHNEHSDKLLCDKKKDLFYLNKHRLKSPVSLLTTTNPSQVLYSGFKWAMTEVESVYQPDTNPFHFEWKER